MYTYKLTEEIVRWVLEVHLRASSTAAANWWVAFTNPTAGPWKRLMAKTEQGMVQVYRFGRDEDRPDLVLVSDQLRLVLIIEAKDKYTALTSAPQMAKSIGVITQMTNKLAGLADNPAWSARAAYRYLPGFLWGRSVSAAREHATVARSYATLAQFRGEPALINFLITADNEGNLAPSLYPSGKLPITDADLGNSFQLPTHRI